MELKKAKLEELIGATQKIIEAQQDDKKKLLFGLTEENKEENFVPNFKDIHISHVLCRNVKTGIEAHGRKDMIHDIDIKNSIIFYTDRAYNIDPDCDIQLDHVQFHTFNP